MSFTHHNHYVPEWYQRRFLDPGVREAKYHHLDLYPEVMTASNGHRFTKKACNYWGPQRCFYAHDLYTTRFGSAINDDIEKHLFGPIDRDGCTAIDHYCDYKVTGDTHRLLRRLIEYMDAQVLRTPRGLARIKEQTRVGDHNQSLIYMQYIRKMHGTMWAECQWEVVDCAASGVDLLVSDNPVTFYNRGLFPGAKACRFPLEPDLSFLGTQTLFPLRRDKLLVLTHLQFARDPRYSPKRPRTNPRLFGETMVDLRTVIKGGRPLTRHEVLKVNFIIKSRAHRYIAASTKDGLYPERELRSVHWPNLATDEFLLPDPRRMIFATSTIASYKNGMVIALDEHGRPSTGNDMADPDRARELGAFAARQKRWTEKYGRLEKGALDHLW